MDSSDTFINLHYLSIIMAIGLPMIFLTTYIIAVSLEHVEAGFPYISDTGTTPPESCIFGQLLNMTAVLMAAIVLVRYAQIKELLVDYQYSRFWKKLNFIALVIGIISTFGMSLVANFQESLLLWVHLTGAVLCFGGATVYIILQTACSWRLLPMGCSTTTVYLRMVLSIFCTICFFVVFSTAALSAKEFTGKDAKKWTSKDGGWAYHLMSTISEWACAIAICIYIITFTNEFREIQLTFPKVMFKADYAKKKYTVFEANPETSPTRSI